MSTRRKFLHQSIIGSAGVITGSSFATCTPRPTIKDPGKAIVVSTWNFSLAANAAAWEVINKKGHALDAVEAGVKVPEADPLVRSVGYGGIPDRDGRVTLDACIMDDKYNCGSVMCLEFIKHPISVARLIMEKTPHIILTGEGALRFALAHGFQKENLLTPWSENYWKEWLKKSNYSPEKNIENKLYDKTNDPMPGGKENHDTIGMLALDQEGRLSGACTTSGLSFKMQGRVGDSPIIGAGLYVDPEVGGATATGVGEEVIRIVGSYLVVELMRQGRSPEAACKEAVERIISRNPAKAKDIQVGFLALNKNGEYGAYALQKDFTFGVKTAAIEQLNKSKSIY